MYILVVISPFSTFFISTESWDNILIYVFNFLIVFKTHFLGFKLVQDLTKLLQINSTNTQILPYTFSRCHGVLNITKNDGFHEDDNKNDGSNVFGEK